jgi:hypothetical protein
MGFLNLSTLTLPLILSLPSLPSHPIQPPSIPIPHSPSIRFSSHPPSQSPLFTQSPFFSFFRPRRVGGSCYNPLRLDFSTLFTVEEKRARRCTRGVVGRGGKEWEALSGSEISTFEHWRGGGGCDLKKGVDPYPTYMPLAGKPGFRKVRGLVKAFFFFATWTFEVVRRSVDLAAMF